MTEKNVSVTAGSACVSCDNPDPCISEITVKGFEDKEYTWPAEKKIILNVLDNGKGKTGHIKVKGKCNEAGCTRPVLESKNEIIPFALNKEKEFTLHYKKKSDQAEPQSALDSVLPFFEQIILPSDAVDGPHTYKLITGGCTGKSSYVQLNVYPTLEVRVVVGFSYVLEGEERSHKERRDEQIAKSKEKVAKKTEEQAMNNMENTLPKNSNKLRTGWTLQTAQFQISNSMPFKIEYGLSIAGKEMQSNFSESTKKIKKIKSLDHISKIEKLFSNIQNNLLPDPDSKKNRKYDVFHKTIEPINMGLSYAYQRTSSYDDANHFSGLYASPLLSFVMKVDLINLILMYCKAADVLRRCNDYIKERNKKSKEDQEKAKLECYLELSVGIDLSIGTVYNNKAWSFNMGSENKLSLTIKGVVSAAFETEILFIEIALKLEGEVKTEAGFKLDQHDDGLDLVGYHDGIKAKLVVVGDIKRNDESPDADSYEASHDLSYSGEWVLAAPLNESESKLRINVFGKERIIAERQVIKSDV